MLNESTSTRYHDDYILVESTFPCQDRLGQLLNRCDMPKPPQGWKVQRGINIIDHLYFLQTFVPRGEGQHPNMRTIHNYHRHALHTLDAALARLARAQGKEAQE